MAECMAWRLRAVRGGQVSTKAGQNQQAYALAIDNRGTEVSPKEKSAPSDDQRVR